MKKYIKTPRGKYYYSPESLFLGVKKIDIQKAKENLLLLNKLAKEHGFKFILFFGSLLGAVRENGLIEHDEDIDIAILSEDKGKFLDFLHVIRPHGFNLIRYDRRGDLYSVMRNGEYIDIYVMFEVYPTVVGTGGFLYPQKYFKTLTEYDLFSDKFWIPKEYEEALIFIYGETWRTPIKYANFEMSKAKRFFFISFWWFMNNIAPLWLYKCILGLKDKQKIATYNRMVDVVQKKYPNTNGLSKIQGA